ncbi:MAG: 4Fe-4S ferredoxin [Deltaproteobacteria bacterium]|nr:4Fe-4S ferredoxin [Deltaproteobacteria bacterium]TLN01023.1 MAG: 4Fe-4S ferredoxin [bacterium]
MKRNIVEIDQEKCDGCGLCVPSCAEGAIKIVNGKAVLAADNLCDGLGACLGECPRDAIRIIEREADEFDEQAVEASRAIVSVGADVAVQHGGSSAGHHGGGCPGSRLMTRNSSSAEVTGAETGSRQSRLGQWPIQLSLVPVTAPFFENADLLIAADCVPFAYADFHKDYLAGKALLVGCPKLDDNEYYTEKLTDIFRNATLKSVTVVRMEVPCCGGIEAAAKKALVASGKAIPFEVVTVGVDGTIR